ncbi:MAG: hypothetical protein KDB14_29700, partial [Planctomycetales bacterium]|nr:hypothetical protein [Planctomycetales bacterium]
MADVGSTFWFTARLKKGAPAPTSSGNVLESHETALVHRTVGGRTLLVEDEPIDREVTLELLSDILTKIDVAEDGAEAVAMATARD